MYERITPDSVDLSSYAAIFGRDRFDKLCGQVERFTQKNSGCVWNVSSTGRGGGVAELLSSALPLSRSLGLNARWLVVDGTREFFDVAKRITCRQYGAIGDGGFLDAEAEWEFTRSISAEISAFKSCVRPGDTVIIHDAQPVPLLKIAADGGAKTVWRNHVGCDKANRLTDEADAFLRPFVQGHTHITVGHSRAQLPEWAPNPVVIRPSVDPTTPKNKMMGPSQVLSILARNKIVQVSDRLSLNANASKHIGVKVQRDGPPPEPHEPMVVQISRWDEQKGMQGLMEAFAMMNTTTTHLTLAGPDPHSIKDDPSSANTYMQLYAFRERLPAWIRSRIQLVTIPMVDLHENALIVNALQRHAVIIVQNSLEEGFGLTVTEAKLKGTPIIATAVGGIKGQVEHERTGLLIPPNDARSLAKTLDMVLGNSGLSLSLARNARIEALDLDLPDLHLLSWINAIE